MRYLLLLVLLTLSACHYGYDPRFAPSAYNPPTNPFIPRQPGFSPTAENNALARANDPYYDIKGRCEGGGSIYRETQECKDWAITRMNLGNAEFREEHRLKVRQNGGKEFPRMSEEYVREHWNELQLDNCIRQLQNRHPSAYYGNNYPSCN